MQVTHQSPFLLQRSPVSSPDVSTAPIRSRINISMFERSRFGGKHVRAAKPNLNVSRKPSQVPVTTSGHEGPGAASAIYPSPDPVPLPKQPHQPSPSRPTVSASPDTFLAPPLPPSVQRPAPAQPVTDHTVVSNLNPFQPEHSAALPLLWPKTMPQQDHKWVSSALFRVGSGGKLELRDQLQLWYYPPQPSLVYHQAPTPCRFFAQSLLLWMPYRLWKVRLLCLKPACNGHPLASGGLHRRVRQVLDVDRYYNLVTETLICTKCRTSQLSWSQAILQQLDLEHRSEFRVILTRRYACDIRVIRQLRERGLGNSPSRIILQLKENHSEEWLQRVARYTAQCAAFMDASRLLQPHFQEPPVSAVLPSYKWLLVVYSQDILNRLEDIKAKITSVYGCILKMDSTKTITKKLSGTATGTAQWLTSVGNEMGQVLISVLTASEGPALDLMAAGLMDRYQSAGVDPPVALYVDNGCCKEVGETKIKAKFGRWPNLIVRLDIWHFMRRLAVGCTTDAHQLYPTFMARMSACIFEWDATDVAELRRAKKAQLLQEGWPALSDQELDKHITQDELALHCRRRTRGEETSIQLLDQLLTELMTGKGNDALGVPLLDTVRMQHIWGIQRRHVRCIQDPPGLALYTETGSTRKGGVVLKTFRCARGSTSLESFHCHLNRFIPGNSANLLNYQIYLLEGLSRWNQDRAAAAVTSEPSTLRTYAGELVHCVNSNYEKVFGRKLIPGFSPPAKYTGELIGVQYLLRQNNEPLQDMHPNSEETSQLMEDLDVEEPKDPDEGFEDFLGSEATIVDLMVSNPIKEIYPPPAVLCPSAVPPPPSAVLGFCLLTGPVKTQTLSD
ncbi:uncharacterized protein [Takifugu rubripes]|uniref:uncharacterized protein n=1 Tax=Takifugu rubripes TaxID=31033 RepID=UPI0011460166|nr:uncharacterized protein LOC115251708 [Takifugu rubripes]